MLNSSAHDSNHQTIHKSGICIRTVHNFTSHFVEEAIDETKFQNGAWCLIALIFLTVGAFYPRAIPNDNWITKDDLRMALYT